MVSSESSLAQADPSRSLLRRVMQAKLPGVTKPVSAAAASYEHVENVRPRGTLLTTTNGTS
jgi:hypothetical protein